MSTPTESHLISESQGGWNKGWEGQLSIDTPELVSLEFPLAGVGSRGLALSIDYLIHIVFYVIVGLGIAALASYGTSSGGTASSGGGSSSSADKWAIAILILVPFLLHWAYFTLFEAFWNGRTPGKRVLRLRVIQQNGRSITFFESLIRNLIRIVDALPSIYAVGVVSLFVTKRHQRLGDLAAGTIVIHEAKQESSLWNGSAARSFTAFMAETAPAAQPVTTTGLPADAVARLNAHDLETIDGFLARRLDIPMEVRERLAARLAAQLRTKMQLDPALVLRDEALIEGVEHDMRSGR